MERDDRSSLLAPPPPPTPHPTLPLFLHFFPPPSLLPPFPGRPAHALPLPQPVHVSL